MATKLRIVWHSFLVMGLSLAGAIGPARADCPGQVQSEDTMGMPCELQQEQERSNSSPSSNQGQQAEQDWQEAVQRQQSQQQANVAQGQQVLADLAESPAARPRTQSTARALELAGLSGAHAAEHPQPVWNGWTRDGAVGRVAARRHDGRPVRQHARVWAGRVRPELRRRDRAGRQRAPAVPRVLPRRWLTRRRAAHGCGHVHAHDHRLRPAWPRCRRGRRVASSRGAARPPRRPPRKRDRARAQQPDRSPQCPRA